MLIRILVILVVISVLITSDWIHCFEVEVQISLSELTFNCGTKKISQTLLVHSDDSLPFHAARNQERFHAKKIT